MKFLSTRRGIAAAACICGTALAVVPAATAGASASSITDPTGDVVDANNLTPRPDVRQADITSAGADYQTGRIVLTLKTDQLTDPNSDPNWIQGVSTAEWALDTHGVHRHRQRLLDRHCRRRRLDVR